MAVVKCGLRYIDCSLFDSPAQTLVNAVNTVGVMGKGVARAFRDIYPAMYMEYRSLCKDGRFSPGMLWLYKSSGKWVLNFPTKLDWRDPSALEYLDSGLSKFVEGYEKYRIESVSFPMLGCGAGGLDWESDVKPLMERYLANLPIDVFVHIPSPEALKRKVSADGQKALLGGGEGLPGYDVVWASLVRLIDRNRGIRAVGDPGFLIEASASGDEISVGAYGGMAGCVIKRDGALAELWASLSEWGFVTGGHRHWLGGLAAWDITVSLLSELFCVQVARIAREERELRDFKSVSLIASVG